jgi:hypothetical protein
MPMRIQRISIFIKQAWLSLRVARFYVFRGHGLEIPFRHAAIRKRGSVHRLSRIYPYPVSATTKIDLRFVRSIFKLSNWDRCVIQK